jgi:phage-related tail fiber protein
MALVKVKETSLKEDGLISIVGHIISYVEGSALSGYIKCNGAPVSRTTYADLFALIGTTFGVGDGSTTFNVPDLRGEFIRGLDDLRGVDVGRTLGSFQDEQSAYLNAVDRVEVATTNTTITVPSNGTFSDRIRAYSILSDRWRMYNYGTEMYPRNWSLLYCIKY